MTAPRRVVHVVCTENFAGVERYVSYVAPCLAERGWDVTVVGGDEKRMREGLGPVPYIRGRSVASAMAALIRLDRSAIVHAHMTGAETAAVAVHIARRFPIVVTRHFAARRGSSMLGRLAAPAIRRTVAEQIAISDYVASAIGEPSVIIRNAVPDDDMVMPGHPPTVLVVQRLEREKRTDDILRAWRGTTLPALGWMLRIAGGGSEHERLATLSRELGVADSVELLGVRRDVNALMKNASLFVATAPTEPFGLSVVEAMAAGLPVICARGGAHLETVGGWNTRWLFEPGDHAELARMLQELATDTAERAAYGLELQKHQRAALSLAPHVDQLETVYERLHR